MKADEDDLIAIDGVPLKKEEEKVVYVLNKPKNVISSASDDRGRKTVLDYVDSPYRLFPMGRLDYDSSGLILLSNDGELMQKLIHPRYEVEKTYEVVIRGQISEEELDVLRKGVKIDDYISSPAKITLHTINKDRNTSFMTITIHEGKNREIRKMFETMDYEVIRLHRIEEAGITLGKLKSGEARRLTPHEVKKLRNYLDHGNL